MSMFIRPQALGTKYSIIDEGHICNNSNPFKHVTKTNWCEEDLRAKGQFHRTCFAHVGDNFVQQQRTQNVCTCCENIGTRKFDSTCLALTIIPVGVTSKEDFSTAIKPSKTTEDIKFVKIKCSLFRYDGIKPHIS